MIIRTIEQHESQELTKILLHQILSLPFDLCLFLSHRINTPPTSERIELHRTFAIKNLLLRTSILLKHCDFFLTFYVKYAIMKYRFSTTILSHFPKYTEFCREYVVFIYEEMTYDKPSKNAECIRRTVKSDLRKKHERLLFHRLECAEMHNSIDSEIDHANVCRKKILDRIT